MQKTTNLQVIISIERALKKYAIRVGKGLMPKQQARAAAIIAIHLTEMIWEITSRNLQKEILAGRSHVKQLKEK